MLELLNDVLTSSFGVGFLVVGTLVLLETRDLVLFKVTPARVAVGRYLGVGADITIALFLYTVAQMVLAIRRSL
jgi:hypothetical protein